jgi:hypothetical protein
MRNTRPSVSRLWGQPIARPIHRRLGVVLTYSEPYDRGGAKAPGEPCTVAIGGHQDRRPRVGVSDQVLAGGIAKPGVIRRPRLMSFARQPARHLRGVAMIDDEPQRLPGGRPHRHGNVALGQAGVVLNDSLG